MCAQDEAGVNRCWVLEIEADVNFRFCGEQHVRMSLLLCFVGVFMAVQVSGSYFKGLMER